MDKGYQRKLIYFFQIIFIISKYYFYNLDLLVPSGTLGYKMTKKIGKKVFLFGSN